MSPRSLFIVFIVCSGCVGTDVGNPPDDRRITATLEFEALEFDDDTAALVTADGTRIDEAWLNVATVRVASGDCESPTETRVEGPFFVEMVSRTVQPEPPVLTTSPRTICAIKLDVSEAGADAPPQLRGRSLYVRGADEGGDFMLESATSRILPYRSDGLLVEQDTRFVNAFDPSEWIDALAGKRVLSDADAAVINAFWTTLRRESRIVDDRDANGRISREEFDGPVALPE